MAGGLAHPCCHVCGWIPFLVVIYHVCFLVLGARTCRHLARRGFTLCMFQSLVAPAPALSSQGASLSIIGAVGRQGAHLAWCGPGTEHVHMSVSLLDASGTRSSCLACPSPEVLLPQLQIARRQGRASMQCVCAVIADTPHMLTPLILCPPAPYLCPYHALDAPVLAPAGLHTQHCSMVAAGAHAAADASVQQLPTSLLRGQLPASQHSANICPSI